MVSTLDNCDQNSYGCYIRLVTDAVSITILYSSVWYAYHTDTGLFRVYIHIVLAKLGEGSTQPLSEMITTNHLGGDGR